jgi:hypothetical protein
MGEITKAKINLKDGLIELEGSEDFVLRILDRYEKRLLNEPITITQPNKKIRPKEPANITRTAVMKKPNNLNSPSKIPSKNIAIKPTEIPSIPINLKGDKNMPSLVDLYREKLPQTHQELITLFVYYISRYLDIPNVKLGHIVSCYNEIGAKKPKRIEQIFEEIRLFSGWLESGEGATTTKITIDGVNLVEHFLPYKSK